MIAQSECGRSIAACLKDAIPLALVPGTNRPLLCYTDGIGHADFIRADQLAAWPELAVRCFEYIVKAKGLSGVIIGECDDRVIVAIPPGCGPFQFEIRKSLLPRFGLQIPQGLPEMAEDGARRVVRVNADDPELGEWLRRLTVGKSLRLLEWTEQFEAALGHSVVSTMVVALRRLRARDPRCR